MQQRRPLTPEEQEMLKEYARKMQEQQYQRVQAARQHAEHQVAIDQRVRRQYVIIAAVDVNGGFAKDGKIPWNYPADLKWFSKKTKGQICIMGRHTYEDINERLGDKAKKSVLPGRRCFVLSSTLKELPNATVVDSLLNIEMHLTEGDDEKVICIIGGGKLFIEGIAIASHVYLTLINKDYQCDQFFPYEYLTKHFMKDKMFKHNDTDELRFTVWARQTVVPT